MTKLIELQTVEETKHLVPNLPVMVKAVFGEKSYLVDWRRSHGDWATLKLKYADGLVWLPWLGQLWLVELEWKEAHESNFFDQSRALVKGKIDVGQLRSALKKCLPDVGKVLDQAFPGMVNGYGLDNVIDITIKNHHPGDRFRPHLWVILGHDGDNIPKLRKQYEDELTDRIKGRQHYILSMVRMFSGDFGSYLLLDQHYSEGCKKLDQVERSILIPAISTVPEPSKEPRPEIIRETKFPGQASQYLAYLLKLRPSLSPENIRLRIEIEKDKYHDFEPYWEDSSEVFRILSDLGVPKKPTTAAKEVFGDKIPEKYGNVARKLGTFIDISKAPPEEIETYRRVEKFIRKYKKYKTKN
jgi:hypothetical protein